MHQLFTKQNTVDDTGTGTRLLAADGTTAPAPPHPHVVGALPAHSPSSRLPLLEKFFVSTASEPPTTTVVWALVFPSPWYHVAQLAFLCFEHLSVPVQCTRNVLQAGRD